MSIIHKITTYLKRSYFLGFPFFRDDKLSKWRSESRLRSYLEESYSHILDIDRFLFLMVFFLMGIGLVQIYSASYIYATDTYNNGLFFFKKQLLFCWGRVDFNAPYFISP